MKSKRTKQTETSVGNLCLCFGETNTAMFRNCNWNLGRSAKDIIIYTISILSLSLFPIRIEYEKLIDVIRFDKDVSACLRFSWCARRTNKCFAIHEHTRSYFDRSICVFVCVCKSEHVYTCNEILSILLLMLTFNIWFDWSFRGLSKEFRPCAFFRCCCRILRPWTIDCRMVWHSALHTSNRNLRVNERETVRVYRKSAIQMVTVIMFKTV